MLIKLRGYQEQAVKHLANTHHRAGNDLAVLATGSGKSYIIAALADRLNKSLLIFQPNKEILLQNYEKLRLVIPKNEIGIYSASCGSKTIGRFTLATIGSVYKRPQEFRHFENVIIDESHLYNPRQEETMYPTFLKGIGFPKVIGLTATPFRNAYSTFYNEWNGKTYKLMCLKLINKMTSGEPNAKPFWKRIVYNLGMDELIRMGHLSELKYIDRSFVPLQSLKLNKARTEIDLTAFAEFLTSKEKAIAETIVELARVRHSVLVFCSTIDQATRIADAIPSAVSISSKTPKKERTQIIKDYKNGRIRIVCNVGILTTGFDHPRLDTIVLMRPTRSVALYSQMMGRVSRKHEYKDYGLIVDYSGTVAEIGRVETIKLRQMEQIGYTKPTWVLSSDTCNQWHNKPLYEY